MKTIILKSALAAFLSATALTSVNAQLKLEVQPAKPNIIVFLVDDMGWQDTSVPFWDSVTNANRKFHTPNMEQFAATSIKFTQAYANSICTPSRVSLLSGMNAARHRVTNWTAFKDKPVDYNDDKLMVPQWNVNGLSPVPGDPRSVYVTTLPQILKNNGYYTIQCGKAHFGAYGTVGADPLKLGFVKNIGGSAAGNPASYLAEDDFGYNPEKFILQADIPNMKKYWHTNTFLTEDLTKEAELAMDTAQMKKKPFFLYMAHYAVHLPYNADQRFVQKYLDEGLTKPEAAYAALVEGMDKSLGDLMKYLDQHNLTQNTIIIFMSDNGGFSHPPRQGNDNTQNYPLRGGKGSLYEGGVREPMMVRWPGVTKAGSICKQYVHIEDFYPTLIEMADIKRYQTVQTVDGESIVPYLKNPKKSDPERVLVWNFPNNWTGGNLGDDNAWMTSIRQGDWKLIYFEKYGRLELYNLRDDIKEAHDLAKKRPAETKLLAKLLTQKLKLYNAQLPVDKLTGKPVPMPDEIVGL
ncbi:sulfatase [Mucilaginibacter arboris]|uniref:Sulfatase-like hydrolase/transferase n=1 Tax=Mucilaginibacter arboris TaxID=2682090 RepID=A0A7K1ST78_9SPHI|nr:sulfatase [Mucilaginibacter arboris]MVN20457.1 sulfatase-like hydrolase/transferase [Mucilaginibacter arboris]